jgi:NADPH:quinone reductase
MRAFALTGFDAPPQYLDVPTPAPGPGEVLVRVHATSVNPVDQLVRSGFFRAAQEYRFPAVFGRDVAGVVAQVGPGVTRYREGDRVYGFVKREHIGDGTFAEYVVVPQDMFIGPAPVGLDLAAAGVLGLSGITALECVDAVLEDRDTEPRGDEPRDAKPRDTVPVGDGAVVLVNGAAGGVGCFAVQIAVARGAQVVATARTPEQAELVRSLGATHVADLSPTGLAGGDLVAQVRDRFPDGIDGFVDLVKHVDSTTMGVGEDEAHATFARLCRGLLRAGGRAASVTNGGVAELLDGVPFVNVHSTPTPATIARLTALVEAGSVAAPIHRSYAFDDLESAFARLAAGPALGKLSVVLEPGSTPGSRTP